MAEKTILLKMLSDSKIPEDILKILGLEAEKKLLVTLYSDGTIQLEPAPTLKIVKTIKTTEPKKTEIATPEGWIPLGGTRFLTPDGSIRQYRYGSFHPSLNKDTVQKIAEIIKSTSNKQEAIKAIMEKLHYTRGTAELHFCYVSRALPHLEKIKPKPKIQPEIRPEEAVKPPEDLVKILEQKEKEHL